MPFLFHFCDFMFAIHDNKVFPNRLRVFFGKSRRQAMIDVSAKYEGDQFFRGRPFGPKVTNYPRL